MTDVAANWQQVCDQAAAAALRAGRDPESVRIIAVSKTKPIEMIAQAIAAGATDIGENYVQEAAPKIHRITAPVTWHMIGHLQRNKAGRAVELFDVIHTLDGVPLGLALARRGEQRGRPVRVLIEVNTGGEASKSGVAPAEVARMLTALAAQPGLLIEGLMTVPPVATSAQAVRPHFRTLRELRARLQSGASANAPLRELSMGMSDDFTVAIEEGATMVRIGRAIFGEREARQ
ncbi:MAG TPA: YggS family pyridoxal phosphate-dependent enzyme [Candidatus Margulisiibacteriota bacterium]|nr:YggS family pyridoxal phosphate-dependent enzyme [Candidatus Margulisiibacteriota bacterium]